MVEQHQVNTIKRMKDFSRTLLVSEGEWDMEAYLASLRMIVNYAKIICEDENEVETLISMLINGDL